MCKFFFVFLLRIDEKRDSSVRGERAQSVSEQKNSRGVFSQLIDKVIRLSTNLFTKLFLNIFNCISIFSANIF